MREKPISLDQISQPISQKWTNAKMDGQISHENYQRLDTD